LGLKATQATTYTKTESDTALALKMNSSGTYTRTSIDTSLALKQGVLSVATPITVSTISCTSLSATSLLTSLSCSGDIIAAGNGSFTGTVSSAGFYSGANARLYHYNYGATSAGLFQHASQLQFAISSTVPPLATEVIMSVGTFTGVAVNKDLSVNNNIYAYGDIYSETGKTFYSRNVANTALWDARLRLGFSINDAIRLYAGPTGIALYQHANDGGAQIVIFQSTDKKAVLYGNITTQTGGSVSASTFTTLSDERVKTDIVNADLAECERLVKTISPKG